MLIKFLGLPEIIIWCYDYQNIVFPFEGIVGLFIYLFAKLSVGNLVFYYLTCESAIFLLVTFFSS